ncbi:MAG TPA: glycoside hydrolase family 127 protein [Armatimonadetes bacterium]|nr:glycoside hydrolase family 127 protein [Armatimonadota bacterium]
MLTSGLLINTLESPHAKLWLVPVENVRIVKDSFWGKRLRILRENTIPSQFRLLSETGRIDNFRYAAGKLKESRGLGFLAPDSDVYKWLEAACWCLAYDPDPEIERLVNTVVPEIADAQDEDGYLYTLFAFRKGERWKNLRDRHELYCAGHLFQAAVAHHRATGRDDLLRVAVRLADHIDSVFGPGRREGASGHPEIEMALVELYRETKDSKYLDLARFLLDCRGKGLAGGDVHHVDHKPFRELTEIQGHAVRSLYLNCGATDIFMETGEEALWRTLERLWHNFTERRMFVTGGAGARYAGEEFGEDYELPIARAYAETCAAVANVMWNLRMFLATGEARFADVLELALFNGALSGISLDGTTYFYQNPLADRGRKRSRWFVCACCPPNIARLLSYLPGMLYAVSREGLWLVLYASSTAKVALGGGRVVEVEQRTNYPWDGQVELTLRPNPEGEFSLFLRIPGWSKESEIFVNGEKVEIEPKPGTFVELRRAWKKGDKVRLLLPMRPELLVAHPRALMLKGMTAIRRGPIIFCLEGVDNPGFDVWDLYIRPDAKLEAEFVPDLLGGVVVVRGEGLVPDMSGWKGRLYVPVREAALPQKRVQFTAIPYFAWANREACPMTVWIGLLD